MQNGQILAATGHNLAQAINVDNRHQTIHPMFLRRLTVVLLTLLLAPFAHARENQTRTLLLFGDSLSAGFGIAREESWPSLLAARLHATHPGYRVVNASISGETSAGGRSRLPAAIEEFHPSLVVIELGANDGLRGLPVSALRDNLSAMVKAAKKAGARVLIIGMKLPPNYGPDYVTDFANSFVAVARIEKCALLPFLLEPLALDRNAFQADGLHPVAEVQTRILDHVWKALKPLL